jgi:lipopolysaccharide export LptBFGC system permease protein LptF
LKKGDKIKMFINNKNEDKNGNLYKNVVTLREDNSLIKSLYDFKDVPKWTSKTKKDAFGKEVTEYDPTPTNEFYISKFLKIVEDFKSASPKKEEQAEKPENSAPTAHPKAYKEKDHDDLPF